MTLRVHTPKKGQVLRTPNLLAVVHTRGNGHPIATVTQGKRGQPIPGAVVSLSKRHDYGILWYNLAPGQYTLRVSVVGLAAKSVKFSVRPRARALAGPTPSSPLAHTTITIMPFFATGSSAVALAAAAKQTMTPSKVVPPGGAVAKSATSVIQFGTLYSVKFEGVVNGAYCLTIEDINGAKAPEDPVFVHV